MIDEIFEILKVDRLDEEGQKAVKEKVEAIIEEKVEERIEERVKERVEEIQKSFEEDNGVTVEEAREEYKKYLISFISDLAGK
jgi:archaellum component FlaD/FlaE